MQLASLVTIFKTRVYVVNVALGLILLQFYQAHSALIFSTYWRQLKARFITWIFLSRHATCSLVQIGKRTDWWILGWAGNIAVFDPDWRNRVLESIFLLVVRVVSFHISVLLSAIFVYILPNDALHVQYLANKIYEDFSNSENIILEIDWVFFSPVWESHTYWASWIFVEHWYCKTFNTCSFAKLPQQIRTKMFRDATQH